MEPIVVAVNKQAQEWLPENKPDGSGVGINYADAYLKALNITFADGTKLSCKRRGIKITIKLGEQHSDVLMRWLEHGPEAHNILMKALEQGFRKLGMRFKEQGGVINIAVFPQHQG